MAWSDRHPIGFVVTTATLPVALVIPAASAPVVQDAVARDLPQREKERPMINPPNHTLEVPGARLHYEVRGTGPLLLLTGSPMSAAEFAPLADVLAAEHTVITHDPRGISGSPLDDPEQDSTPELRADDVVAILDALGAESADVFGSSGGAVTALALAARHPGRVRTIVATNRRCSSCFRTPPSTAPGWTTSSRPSTGRDPGPRG